MAKMTPFIIFTFLLTCCQGFIIPVGLPDGVYSISFDNKGNALGEPTFLASIDNLKSSVNVTRRQSVSLPSPTVNCYGRNLNRGDFDSVFNSFLRNCDKGGVFPAWRAMWLNVGSAVTYFCNYDNEGSCVRGEATQAHALLDVNCRASGVGDVFVDAYKKSYGRENSGVSICFGAPTTPQ